MTATLTVDALLRAKDKLESGGPIARGVKMHPADLAGMKRREIPDSLVSGFACGFAGLPVMTDPDVPRGEYRIAWATEEWRSWQGINP